MSTKIRGDQIQLTDFIQALAHADWTSDTKTASAAAILAKIQTVVAGVAGAMLFRGAWSLAATDVIKKGYVYVYDGNGTAPTGVTLENGDTLIANQDSASIATAAHWTIVQVNITGAVTEANLVSLLLNNLTTTNSNLLSFAIPSTGADAGKLRVTVNFPTVSGGSAESGKYVSAISLNSTTGVISVTKTALPSQHLRVVLDEAMTGTINGTNKTFYTGNRIEGVKKVSVYVNGVKQHAGVDYAITKEASGTYDGKGKVVFDNSAYIPQEGDVVTCDYVASSEISAS